MNSSSNHRLRSFLLYSFSIWMVLLSTDLSIAKQVTFEREYTYQASEADSKLSCRAIALEQVKRLLLEELGTYLESRTEIKDFKLTKDQIITLTAGIVRTEIVKETWDGKTYWLKAKIEADPDEVIKSVDSLRKDHQKTKELEETRRKAAEYLKEMERLKSELALAKGDTKKQGEYNEAVKGLSATDWFEKGSAYLIAKKYKDAVNAYTRAIELDPKDPKIYVSLGVAHYNSYNYGYAIADCTRAIELDPKNAWVYNNRGLAYLKLGRYKQAIADFTKAIELRQNHIMNFMDAFVYKNRAIAYEKLGNSNQAIADYTRAIELDPKNAFAYSTRGLAYEGLGNYNQAIADYTKAIELNHLEGFLYYLRGSAYKELGKRIEAFRDYKRAARLGDGSAQDYLREQGIDW
ncbi:MAG: tetratricopeptide repeat protein [Thermodesulfobacteriota bacterium]